MIVMVCRQSHHILFDKSRAEQAVVAIGKMYAGIYENVLRYSITAVATVPSQRG